jgi:hypothetical protein
MEFFRFFFVWAAAREEIRKLELALLMKKEQEPEKPVQCGVGMQVLV